MTAPLENAAADRLSKFAAAIMRSLGMIAVTELLEIESGNMPVLEVGGVRG